LSFTRWTRSPQQDSRECHPHPNLPSARHLEGPVSYAISFTTYTLYEPPPLTDEHGKIHNPHISNFRRFQYISISINHSENTCLHITWLRYCTSPGSDIKLFLFTTIHSLFSCGRGARPPLNHANDSLQHHGGESDVRHNHSRPHTIQR
jgi:hypothetical protein